jgi:Dolichyl-phosphate-mannose-protein mannosyltransferase
MRSPTPAASPVERSVYRTAAAEALAIGARLTVPTLVAIALALRLTYFLLNPSLSNDEASLALNLMHRSYAGVLERLDFNQAAPPGFLLLQKLAIDVFGASTYSLRLLPFLAGAAASLLVYPVAARIAGRPAALVALALFAVSGPLVSYASTNKQYSVDVAVTLGLYAVMLAVWQRLDARHTVLLAFVGVVAVFLSHPAVFVLAAVWVVLAAENVVARRWRQVAALGGLGALWLGSLATAYLLTRTSIEQIQLTAGLGWTSWHSALRTLGGIARYLLSIPGFAPEVRAAITCIAIVLCFVGVRAQRRRGLTAALVVPAILANAAVWIGRYPNFGRTFLFVEPSLIVLIASGTHLLLSRRRPKTLRAGTGLALLILLGGGAFQTLRYLRPNTVTEPSRALSYLVEHTRSGDSLYLSRTAQYSFRYYLECGCFANSRVVAKARALWPIRPTAGYGQFDAALESSPPSLIAGSSTDFSERAYADDFAPLLGRRRVWILLSDVNPDAKRALTAFLQDHGRLLDVFPNHDENAVASVLLYTLRPEE